MSSLPTVRVSSGPSIWPGFEFQEVEVPSYGTFDKSSANIAVVMHVVGPMKVRLGGSRRPFRDVPTHPTLTLPGDGKYGAWKGSAQFGRHLFIEPDAFERTTHLPFRHGALRLLEGPNPAIEQLLQALRMDTMTGHPSGATLGETIISSILHQIILQSGAVFAMDRVADLSHRELGRIHELIEEELASSLTLERLAAAIGVSVRHLCRSFRASNRLSIHQYIVGRRIERAKSLIGASELSLEEIAETVGFAHQSHMTAAFRRRIGATPAQFRNRRPMTASHST